jgi:hypothetical protein
MLSQTLKKTTTKVVIAKMKKIRIPLNSEYGTTLNLNRESLMYPFKRIETKWQKFWEEHKNLQSRRSFK